MTYHIKQKQLYLKITRYGTAYTAFNFISDKDFSTKFTNQDEALQTIESLKELLVSPTLGITALDEIPNIPQLSIHTNNE